ncbi:hypothetical protein OHA84_29540 [Streptomyces sp. NBC_00513]|uniref:hypothetical protein n=1 Tax=unclassified Streptomyces TaxID=2593676 RepID=UPI0022514B77|nr:hypothetical protein [Streptomyces sp. NBC_00424]MCX5072343.1 hypothetical protein [Streptomyces sp. NBC_00424]WUD44312.1 hypothetical protein OHA84_29540 [Streptomyces sp. NBC_00513]
MLVDPARLLDDCERAWREAGEPTAVGETDPVVRRIALVVEALVAHALLADQSDLPPDLVFARWPACTVHAVALGDQGHSPGLARLLSDARERVIAARPALDRPRGVPSAPTHDARWIQAAQEAARSLGWTWHPWTAADPTHTPATPAGDPEPWAATTAPELRLGLDTGSVLLTLPGNQEACAWQLAADGESFTASPPHWVLPGPVRRIEATDPAGAAHVSVVVDPHTALLAFAADGHLIPLDEPLPAADVHLLHVGTLESEGTRVAAVELPTPYGWSGWTLSKVRLSGVRRLRTSQAAPEGWLDVAVGRSLGWEGGATLTWLTSEDGAPVWHRPPALRLRRLPGEPEAHHWQVEVRRPGHQEPLASLTGTPGTLVDPWQNVPGPLLGPYELLVHSPGRRRGRRRLNAFLAEGVEVTPSAEWRLLAPHGGLAPARLDLRTDRPVTASESAVRLAPHDISRRLVLSDGASAYQVQALVPHSEVRLELDGRPLSWSVRPLDIDAVDLARDSALTVRLPEQAVAVTPELTLVVEGATLHTLRPERRTRTRKGDLRYALAALTDTIRDCGKAELRLAVAGQSVHVGTVRTQPIAEDVVPDGTGLLLRGLRHPGELTARLHPVLAPWQQPLTVRVDESGHIPLPAAWQSVGPLVVTLRAGTRTSGVAPAWPRLRDRDTLVLRRLRRPSAVTDGSAAATTTEYLGGRETLPRGTDAIPYHWIVAARGRDLRACGAKETAQAECLHALGDAGPDALVGAADSALRSGELAAALVGSGLAALRIREVTNPAAVRPVWRRAPLCALLLTAPLLPYLSDDPAYEAGELYPDEAELLSEVGQFLGDSGPRLLAGHEDPSRTVGRFDAHARALDELPEIQQQAVWRTARVVPRGLLDTDTRADAAWRAFRDRRTLQSYAVREECGDWLDAVAIFLDDGHHLLARTFRDRGPGPLHGPQEAWMRVPQFSLGCALIARLAAAGDARAAKLERGLRPLWTSVAAHAPELTAVDLALAECLVTAEAVRAIG